MTDDLFLAPYNSRHTLDPDIDIKSGCRSGCHDSSCKWWWWQDPTWRQLAQSSSTEDRRPYPADRSYSGGLLRGNSNCCEDFGYGTCMARTPSRYTLQMTSFVRSSQGSAFQEYWRRRGLGEARHPVQGIEQLLVEWWKFCQVHWQMGMWFSYYILPGLIECFDNIFNIGCWSSVTSPWTDPKCRLRPDRNFSARHWWWMFTTCPCVDREWCVCISWALGCG